MNISQRLRTCARHTGLDAVIELLNEAADEIERLSAAQPAEVTDEQIESEFQRCGGKWDGNQWVIEDADLHPFARAILALRPVQVPMTDEQVDSFMVDGRLHWLGKRQLIRAVEAHHGIKPKEQE